MQSWQLGSIGWGCTEPVVWTTLGTTCGRCQAGLEIPVGLPMWSLVGQQDWKKRHLKRAGVPQEDLVALYKVLIRPVLDYASSVYHSQLTGEQTAALEKLQRDTLKTIYGFSTSYNEMLSVCGLEALHERRSNAFDEFVVKLAENEAYNAEWLPQQEFCGYNLRKELIYKELYASTERLRRSPPYAARRRLNEIYLHAKNKNDNNN